MTLPSYMEINNDLAKMFLDADTPLIGIFLDELVGEDETGTVIARYYRHDDRILVEYLDGSCTSGVTFEHGGPRVTFMILETDYDDTRERCPEFFI